MKFLFSISFILLMLSGWAFPPDSTAIYHKVVSGETLPGIAKKYHVKESQIKQWNKLTTPNLFIAQRLIVGYKHAPQQQIVAENLAQADSLRKAAANKPKVTPSLVKPKSPEKPASPKAPVEFVSNGLASWSNTITPPNQYAALFNGAPEGTIIKVTCTSTNKAVYVKVIGLITDAYPADNLIILTKIAADKLGVTEQDFECSLSFTKE